MEKRALKVARLGLTGLLLAGCGNLDSRPIEGMYGLSQGGIPEGRTLNSIPVKGYASLGEAVRKNMGIKLDGAVLSKPYNPSREFDYPEGVRKFCLHNDRDPNREGLQMNSDGVAACALALYAEERGMSPHIVHSLRNLERLATRDAQVVLNFMGNQAPKGPAKTLVGIHDDALNAYRRGEKRENIALGIATGVLLFTAFFFGS